MSKILGTSNLDYHSDTRHLSSSSLKVVLKDPRLYFETYILRQHKQEEKDAFSEGSFCHSLILEPHKVATDYAIFPGIKRAGAAWEEFKSINLNKICLSQVQVDRCEKLYKAYAAMGVATELIKGGFAEHNMTGTILGVPVKARADYISPQRNIIIDVKTTAMPSDIDLFRDTIEQYSYHLSASMYCEIAWQTYPGEMPFDFYWLVLSKKDGQCHVYKASDATLAKGNALVRSALYTYKSCLESGNWVANRKEVSYNSDNYTIEEV